MNARKKKKAYAALAEIRWRARALPDLQETRLRALEEAVEQLSWRSFHEMYPDTGRALVVAPAAQERFVKATADGWVTVMVGSTRTAAASGTKVSLNASSGGRDTGTILEGALQGQSFDVATSYLTAEYARIDSLVVQVGKRAGGPVVIGGVSYDLELRLAYSEGGTARSAGPYSAATDPRNPTPPGRHALELPDFPHSLGAGYGPHGTVWFRIGHTGDRYLHPGRFSAGCITCAPDHWEAIYHITHCARSNDGKSVGLLEMA